MTCDSRTNVAPAEGGVMVDSSLLNGSIFINRKV